MSIARIHRRIIQHSFTHHMQGARLDSYQKNDHSLILEVQGFQSVSSELFKRNGKLFERTLGKYTPLKLIFSNISKLKFDDFFASLENRPQDNPLPTISFMFSWIQPGETVVYYKIMLCEPVIADIYFYARQIICERQGEERPITVVRNWSPAPPMPDRLVPQPNYLHRLFGGDPITIKINDQIHRHRLFIGGLDIQPKQRPQVHAVLNLGEGPSRWAKRKPIHPNDRPVLKGEGSQGMSVAEIHDEANWVINRLKQDQRVLVHCVAGMNRSVTICCAVLILLERLTAADALSRIHENHPWARPDSQHWLALRWLEKNRKA